MSAKGICRVCQGPAMHRSTLCHGCFVTLYPEAAARSFDTRVSRSMAQINEAYEKARAADEADAPREKREP